MIRGLWASTHGKHARTVVSVISCLLKWILAPTDASRNEISRRERFFWIKSSTFHRRDEPNNRHKTHKTSSTRKPTCRVISKNSRGSNFPTSTYPQKLPSKGLKMFLLFEQKLNIIVVCRTELRFSTPKVRPLYVDPPPPLPRARQLRSDFGDKPNNEAINPGKAAKTRAHPHTGHTQPPVRRA